MKAFWHRWVLLHGAKELRGAVHYHNENRKRVWACSCGEHYCAGAY